MLLNTMSGMLGSKIIKYDIYKKTYEVNRYGYFADFEENKTISPNPVYNNNSIDEFENIPVVVGGVTRLLNYP
mgnify:CR=1 FL=1